MLVQYPANSVRRMSVGTGIYREEGGIRFVFFLDAGEGTSRANDWGAALADLFRYATFDGVQTEAPSSPYFDDSNDVAGRFLAAVVVPYTFTFTDNGV